MKKTEHILKVGRKSYPYTITPVNKKEVHFECKEAGISQEFLAEDIPALLIDLPELIEMDKEFEHEYRHVLRFRLNSKEKKKIQQNAKKHGYKNISAFLRDLALNA